MRRGEVLGLRWSALDWEGGTLRVTHSVKRAKTVMPRRVAGLAWWSVN
jgi:integrase